MAGPQCCANPPTLCSSCGAGVVEQVGGFNTYVTGSLDSKRAVILISDALGYEAPNLRKLADKVAAPGFYVVVPDFFYGDPYDFDKGTTVEWLASHGTDKGTEDAKTIIQDLKCTGLSSIGAAGFCWGGKVVVQLANSDDIKAGVMLHPASVTLNDIKAVTIPIAILGAEVDEHCPPELLKQYEEILSAKQEVDSHVKLFPGVEHGWTTMYNNEDEAQVKSAEEAHHNMLGWLTKYVI